MIHTNIILLKHDKESRWQIKYVEENVDKKMNEFSVEEAREMCQNKIEWLSVVCG